MYQDCYLVPRTERWVVESLATWVSQRLAQSQSSAAQRTTLLRLLFALQSFPRIRSGVSLQVEWEDNETACIIRIDQTECSVERGHTRLQYFQGSSHLIHFYSILSGQDRTRFLEEWLPFFQDICDFGTLLAIDDHSTGLAVDSPPLNEQWTRPMAEVYFEQGV